MEHRFGTVSEFDDAAGYGRVGDDTRQQSWFFHCTAVADGTRTIDPGTPVSFWVVPGRNGIWEATDLRPAPALIG